MVLQLRNKDINVMVENGVILCIFSNNLLPVLTQKNQMLSFAVVGLTTSADFYLVPIFETEKL